MRRGDWMLRKRRGVRRLHAVAALIVAVSLFLASCGSGTREPTRFPGDVAQTVDRIVESSMAAGLIPGAQVSIIDPKLGTYVHAYGVSDIGTGRPSDTHDRYRIASITKTFTATAVLRLADQGKLALGDHLSQYVDGIPYGDLITLHDLLGMRGGVYNFLFDPSYQPYVSGQPEGHVYDRESALRVIRSHPERAQPPNTRTAYSNSEYLLLGMVLEKVTGRPVREVLNAVAADHGLSSDTEYPLGAAILAPASQGYGYPTGDEPIDTTSYASPDAVGAAGAMVSTAADLGEYVLKLSRGDLLSPKAFRDRTTFTPMQEIGYGLGLMKLGSWLGHDGSLPGFGSIALALPERGVSVVVLINQETPNLSPFSVRASDIFARIVAALYPATMGAPDSGPPAPELPIPSPADLTPRLEATIDPASNPAQPLPIEGTDADPGLPGAIADAYRSQGISLRVDRTTDFGNAVMAATTTLSVPSGSGPMIVTLIGRSGAWTLPRTWACASLVRFSQYHSPACE